MVGYLEDLDELVLKCRNKNAREYIRESVACYRAGAYRSSIVACWVAVCYDLIEKLRELSLAGDGQADDKIRILNEIHRENDTSRSLKFEREILEFSRDKLEIISALEYEDLHRILRDRHRCAHPSLNAEEEHYSPPAELARLHIHSAVTHLLQHEPAQGKFALERVLEQINSKYFPTNKEGIQKALLNSPIRRARPSLVRNLISVLLKDLLLAPEADYTMVSKLTGSLSVVFEMHKIIYEERCAEVLSEISARITDNNLYRLVECVWRFPLGWDALGGAQQDRLKNYVQKLPRDRFDTIEYVIDFLPLKDFAAQRIQYATLEDLDSGLFFTAPPEIIDRYIVLYHESGSFDKANKVAQGIKSHSFDFSPEQVTQLISVISANAQIMGSFEMPRVLEKFKKTAQRHGIDFDELLRAHGLEEYI